MEQTLEMDEIKKEYLMYFGDGILKGTESVIGQTIDLEEGELNDDDEVLPPPLKEVDAVLFGDEGEQRSDATKRFHLFGDITLAVPKEELLELYESLGINAENERHYRFNTVHLRGTRNMKTNDIFEYFSGLKPARVDWLEEGICNVQWDDEVLPARALLYLSVPIIGAVKKAKIEKTSYDHSDSEGSDIETNFEVKGKQVYTDNLKFQLPPGKWRKGEPHKLSKRIIMRYANKDDKKLPVPPGRDPAPYLLRRQLHGKRTKYKEIHVDGPTIDPWGPLATTWGRGEGVERNVYDHAPAKNMPDLRSSLNNMIESRFADCYLRRAAELHKERPVSPPVFLDSSSDSEASDDDFMRRRKLPKMRADIEEEKIRRARLEKAARNNDLRSKINLKAKSASKTNSLSTRNQKESREDESDDDLCWAKEGYTDLKMTVENRDQGRDGLESDSGSEICLDEPELLQIEVDNEYFRGGRRRND